MNADARADCLMARQHALITFAQALQCGLTVAQVKQRLHVGRWILVVRGVYRSASAPVTWRQAALAAVLARPDAVACDLTAAALHGLGRPPSTPHATVPPGTSARLPIARVHRRVLERRDTLSVDGIRVTSPARTLVDCAAVVSAYQLARLVDDAFCGRFVAVRSVFEAVERANARRVVGALLQLVETWTPGIQPGSPAEMRLLRRLQEWGYPAPVLQHEVRDISGAVVAILDIAWPASLVGLEYDSDRWHSPTRWDHDEYRLERLRTIGWTIRGVGKTDLLPRQTWLRDEIGRLLGEQAA